MDAVFKAFRGWVVAATGLDEQAVIEANDSGVRPGKPYATILVTSSGGRTGHEEQHTREDSGGDIRDITVGTRRTTATVTFFGDTAEDLCEELRMHKRRAARYVHSDGPTLVVTSVGAGLDVAAIVGTTHERRYAVDCRIAYAVASVSDTPVDPMQQAILDPLTYDDGDPFEETVTLEVT